MSFHQIRPFLIWTADCKIGINISVGLLGAPDQRDRSVGDLYVFPSGTVGNTEGDCFQPFI